MKTKMVSLFLQGLRLSPLPSWFPQLQRYPMQMGQGIPRSSCCRNCNPRKDFAGLIYNIYR